MRQKRKPKLKKSKEPKVAPSPPAPMPGGLSRWQMLKRRVSRFWQLSMVLCGGISTLLAYEILLPKVSIAEIESKALREGENTIAILVANEGYFTLKKVHAMLLFGNMVVTNGAASSGTGAVTDIVGFADEVTQLNLRGGEKRTARLNLPSAVKHGSVNVVLTYHWPWEGVEHKRHQRYFFRRLGDGWTWEAATEDEPFPQEWRTLKYSSE